MILNGYVNAHIGCSMEGAVLNFVVLDGRVLF